MNIISSFEQEHQELSKLVEEIRLHDFKSDLGRDLLMRHRLTILSHFNRLNMNYCSSLSQFAAKHYSANINRLLKVFSTEMQLHHQTIKEFFLRYRHPEVSIDFASESGRVFALLVHCVHKQSTVVAALRRNEGGNADYELLGSA